MRQARFVLIDDIDGSTAQETVVFGVGRQQYEIDLNSEHLAEFTADMERWVKHARRVSSRRGARTVHSPASNDAALIRTWAADRGIKLSSRGRIPAAIRDQYYAETAQGF